MFDQNYSYATRQAQSGIIKCSRKASLDLVQASFRCRAARLFNSLPEDLRGLSTDQTFKNAVKEWIRKSVDVQ